MNKRSKIVDIIVLAILTVLGIDTLFLHFSVGYTVYLNYFLGLILLVTGVFIKVKNGKFSNYVVLSLLILASAGVVNFLASTVEFGEPSHAVFLSYRFSGINLLFALMLIIYLVINHDLYRKVFKASAQEEDEKFKKLVDFYYDKFKDSGSEELSDIMNRYDQYPLEARTALDKIRSQTYKVSKTS